MFNQEILSVSQQLVHRVQPRYYFILKGLVRYSDNGGFFLLFFLFFLSHSDFFKSPLNVNDKYFDKNLEYLKLFQNRNLNFLILISLQHDFVDLLIYFNFIQSNSQSLKYKEFSPPGCKDIFLRNL